MKRLDTNVPGLYFPEEPPEVIEQRRLKNEQKLKIAHLLGVDLTRFDEDPEDDKVFKSKEEKRIYEMDVFQLGVFLNEGKDLPSDLVARLLTIKERRENLKKKK